MIYMLDTNIIIYFIKQRPISVVEKINSLSPNDRLVMSFVTYTELLKGANGSQNPEKTNQMIERMRTMIEVLYPNEKTCDFYAKWANALKQKGTPIGNNDLWIASHALSCNAVLVTHNTKEFQRINELSLQDWAR